MSFRALSAGAAQRAACSPRMPHTARRVEKGACGSHNLVPFHTPHSVWRAAFFDVFAPEKSAYFRCPCGVRVSFVLYHFLYQKYGVYLWGEAGAPGGTVRRAAVCGAETGLRLSESLRAPTSRMSTVE